MWSKEGENFRLLVKFYDQPLPSEELGCSGVMTLRHQGRMKES